MKSIWFFIILSILSISVHAEDNTTSTNPISTTIISTTSSSSTGAVSSSISSTTQPISITTTTKPANTSTTTSTTMPTNLTTTSSISTTTTTNPANITTTIQPTSTTEETTTTNPTTTTEETTTTNPTTTTVLVTTTSTTTTTTLPEDSDDDIHIMNNGIGAEMRLLQLQKSILKNVLIGHEIIKILKKEGKDTKELENIINELIAVKDEVKSIEPKSNDSVQRFVDLKKDSIGLSKDFREVARPLMTDSGFSSLKKFYIDNQEYKDLEIKIKELRIRHNQNALKEIKERYKLKDDFMRKFNASNINISELKMKIQNRFNEMKNEERKAAIEKIKERDSINEERIQKLKEKSLEHKENRTNERIKKIEQKENKELKEYKIKRQEMIKDEKKIESAKKERRIEMKVREDRSKDR